MPVNAQKRLTKEEPASSTAPMKGQFEGFKDGLSWLAFLAKTKCNPTAAKAKAEIKPAP